VRLLSAHIKNFRLLRDVELPFSTNKQQPLTVIRAENASGKTSTLKALKWALFGKAGLDSTDERLSPIDWPDRQRCELSVRVEFEHTMDMHVDSDMIRADTQKYTLIRTAIETPEGNIFKRGAQDLKLLHHTDAGAEPVSGAESKLREIIPSEMKDIFFTDGDAALTFISADAGRTTKIDQVRNAIRSLLGLGLLEDVEKALQQTRSRLLKRQRDESEGDELADVTRLLQEKEELRTQTAAEFQLVSGRVLEAERRLVDADKELQRALTLGDHVELANQRETVRKQLKECHDREEQLVLDHTKLLKGKALSWALIGPELLAGVETLKALHDRGVIPKASLPILRERLEAERCICGASLATGTDGRRHVEQLLDNERNADDHSRLLTSLYHTAAADREDAKSPDSDFATLTAAVRRERALNLRTREDLERQGSELDQRLREIDAVDIQQKKQSLDTARSQARHQERRQSELERDLRELEPQIAELDVRQKELRKKEQKLRSLNAQITATEDLLVVVKNTLDDMQRIYLKKVSDRMNDLFMEMVGAEPGAGGVYQSAQITPEYEIVVNSFDGRRLNPDHEVNGASQRALTFSFIWALTEVSGISAPRVIDTPLGMMAGLVKQRVLNLISTPPAGDGASHSADHQVVMLLTQSEIADTEDILDARVGASITYTNSEHFPRDVINQPNTTKPTVLVCPCSHRQYCEHCERRSRRNYDLVARR
jgi:DNA sulfur modification protein DndD